MSLVDLYKVYDPNRDRTFVAFLEWDILPRALQYAVKVDWANEICASIRFLEAYETDENLQKAHDHLQDYIQTVLKEADDAIPNLVR